MLGLAIIDIVIVTFIFYILKKFVKWSVEEIRYIYRHGFIKIKFGVYVEEESLYQEAKQEELNEEKTQKVRPQKRYTTVEYAEVLNISPGASKAEIKVAYRRMARKYHTDINRNVNDEQMKLINLAREELMKVASYG